MLRRLLASCDVESMVVRVIAGEKRQTLDWEALLHLLQLYSFAPSLSGWVYLE